MSQSIVRYTGTFRFRERSQLEHALRRARARVNDEQELAALDGGWLRCFVMRDLTLTVNIAIPALPPHQTGAAEVFALLSQEAEEGSVTARIDNVPVEDYAVRPVRARGTQTDA